MGLAAEFPKAVNSIIEVMQILQFLALRAERANWAAEEC
jgi:hypothetical protein